MNLESVTGPDGRTPPLAAQVQSSPAGDFRPGRRDTGSEGAAEAPRERPVEQREPVSRAELERLVDEVNSDLAVLNEKLGFQVHEGTGQIVVQIVDRDSGEIVRESPPREFLDLAVRMREMVGLFLDEQG